VGDSDPSQVGRYEVIRKLGEGGLGTVYLAEPGPVAIKLLHSSLDPELTWRRFLRERDFLMQLSHENIARLVESGRTDNGTLYLVLEYVDGWPLDDACHRDGLDLKERLLVFRKVCQTMSFAHARQVVHRDLKPANILLRRDHQPIVLDFGLAKLVSSSLGDALDSTKTGHRQLTPEYASPEQILGAHAGPGMDIYALGLILYELLSGSRPQRFRTWSIAEVKDVVCHRHPPAPSQALAARQGNGPAWPIQSEQLHGSLDGIVMRALVKDPGDRYRHVAELDDDVGRFLEGRPVLNSLNP
jgi:serine/threonine-protein kinase